MKLFRGLRARQDHRDRQPHGTREEIIAFAQQFDPQPFHVDEDAAAESHFGGLIASGWHTCSVMMRMMVATAARGRHAWARPASMRSAGSSRCAPATR